MTDIFLYTKEKTIDKLKHDLLNVTKLYEINS
jgi:hypothetical protein